jgi:membrane fusion protein (multidrug efflux system)
MQGGSWLNVVEAGLKVQERQIEALRAQRNNAEASLQQAIAQRDQAQLNLDYATVTAAEPGRAVNLTALPGEFARNEPHHVRPG